MAFKQRTYTEVPQDEAISPQIREFLASLLSQVNALSGQGAPTAGQGIAALSQSRVNPASGQIMSLGSWAPSVTTPVAFTTTTTSATFYWDGTHGSAALQIYRDNGVVTGPIVAGSGFTVSGLAANTKYFFYLYWDDVLSKVVFASVPGISVGTPAVAFTAQNVQALAQQIQRGHIALAQTLASSGLTTPSSGTGGGSGGGGGGGGSGCPLSGAPVRLYGDPAWWTRTVVPNEEFYRIVTVKSGHRVVASSDDLVQMARSPDLPMNRSCEAFSFTTRIGIFSRTDRRYCRRGLLPLSEWTTGDFALTEDGEEQVQLIEPLVISGATVDRYEATQGHIYSAWGFIGHNVKPF